MFVKWTGDGFLAFYECPLDRDIGPEADLIFRTAFTLTLIVNVTQLCVAPKERISIRHAVTYEKDALLIDLLHSGDMKSKDVLGRNVVTAFRLSGLSCAFPNIVTHKEVLRAIEDAGVQSPMRFASLPLKKELRTRYFKGEKFGSRDIYVTTDRRRIKPAAPRIKAAKRTVTKMLAAIEAGKPLVESKKVASFGDNFCAGLSGGPSWCQAVFEEWKAGFFEPTLDIMRQFLDTVSELESLMRQPEDPQTSVEKPEKSDLHG